MLTKLAGKRIFSNGATIDETVEYRTTNWAVRRYGSGYQVNDPRGVGHLGVIAEVQQDALNARLTSGTMPDKALAVLAYFGLEGSIEDLDWSDLHFLRSTNGYSAMRVILDAIKAAAPAGPEPPIEPPPAGEILGNYPGAPPHNAGTGVETVFERLARYGLIMSSTAYDGPLPSQMGFARRYWQNKLVPNVSEEAWMLKERGLRPLPEQAPVREDGIYLYDQLELRIAEWGKALAENELGADERQAAARAAYWAFEEAFVPKSDAGAPPAHGDRIANPRSVLYAGRFIENAIEHGLPNSAAWCCPRAAFTLGTPQHLSRYEQWGFSSQPLDARDWRGILGVEFVDEGNEWPGGPGREAAEADAPKVVGTPKKR